MGIYELDPTTKVVPLDDPVEFNKCMTQIDDNLEELHNCKKKFVCCKSACKRLIDLSDTLLYRFFNNQEIDKEKAIKAFLKNIGYKYTDHAGLVYRLHFTVLGMRADALFDCEHIEEAYDTLEIAMQLCNREDIKLNDKEDIYLTRINFNLKTANYSHVHYDVQKLFGLIKKDILKERLTNRRHEIIKYYKNTLKYLYKTIIQLNINEDDHFKAFKNYLLLQNLKKDSMYNLHEIFVNGGSIMFPINHTLTLDNLYNGKEITHLFDTTKNDILNQCGMSLDQLKKELNIIEMLDFYISDYSETLNLLKTGKSKKKGKNRRKW